MHEFKIDRNGNWFHKGEQIKREALAKLFADRALKIDENGNYWLQTPYEKYSVDVEDVPFIVLDYEEEGDTITFRTNMNETIELGKAHPLELRAGLPYIEIRDGLFARINRAVFYNLVETYGESVQGFALGETE